MYEAHSRYLEAKHTGRGSNRAEALRQEWDGILRKQRWLKHGAALYQMRSEKLISWDPLQTTVRSLGVLLSYVQQEIAPMFKLGRGCSVTYRVDSREATVAGRRLVWAAGRSKRWRDLGQGVEMERRAQNIPWLRAGKTNTDQTWW